MGEFSHIGGNERYEGRSDEVRRHYRAHFPQVCTSAAAAEIGGLRLNKVVGTTSAAWQ